MGFLKEITNIRQKKCFNSFQKHQFIRIFLDFLGFLVIFSDFLSFHGFFHIFPDFLSFSWIFPHFLGFFLIFPDFLSFFRIFPHFLIISTILTNFLHIFRLFLHQQTDIAWHQPATKTLTPMKWHSSMNTKSICIIWQHVNVYKNFRVVFQRARSVIQSIQTHSANPE